MLIYTLRESYLILKGRKSIKEVIKTCIICNDSMRNPYRYQKDSSSRPGAYRLYQKVNLEKLKNVEELNPISWKFIPPQVPWWGSFWERLIGPVKRTLRKTPGITSLNHEEMYTVLCDCESLINSRPLTYVTDDVEDLEPLTPAMFCKTLEKLVCRS
ncbi:integrase catalytic domain-containing protein [Trichonephila clavipes]|nr:integrase catalytic domain-containing protein [Trichonephila clavipes]